MATHRSVALALLTVSLACVASPAAAQVVLQDALPSTSLTFAVPDPSALPTVVVPIAAPQIDRAAVRRELAHARAQHIRQLRAYARAEQFPTNDVQPGMLNVVMDEEGHICAAANLMALDGNLDLVRATAAANNFVRFIDVHDGAAYEWMLASGFTQEEIDQIQEPYFFISEQPVGPSFQEQRHQENRRVRRVLMNVARRLATDTDANLEIATDRLIAYRASRAA